MLTILLVTAIFFGQVACNDLPITIDLVCPDGWLANDLFWYQTRDSQTNTSMCLICEKNLVLSQWYKYLEICANSNLGNVQEFPQKLTKMSFNEAHVLKTKPFCGASFTANKGGASVKFDKFLPCSNADHIKTSWKQSIDLTCPKSFKLTSLIRKSYTISFQRNKNPHSGNTICLVGNPNELYRGLKTTLTICPMSAFHRSYTDYDLTASKALQCNYNNLTMCARNTFPKIDPSQHCGARIVVPSTKTEDVKISEYIHCSEDNVNQKQASVALCTCFGSCTFLILSYL